MALTLSSSKRKIMLKVYDTLYKLNKKVLDTSFKINSYLLQKMEEELDKENFSPEAVALFKKVFG